MILNDNYYYLVNSFKGSNGVWRLVGTDGTSKFAKDAIDTFKNDETGKYIEVPRYRVLEMQNEGKISALEILSTEKGMSTKVEHKTADYNTLLAYFYLFLLRVFSASLL